MSTLYIGCEPGVTLPVRTGDVHPRYTLEAMRAKIEGIVELRGVVDIDGKIRESRVVRSLDTAYGLDEQARKALEEMGFLPGTLNGRPARTLVTFELQFTLR